MEMNFDPFVLPFFLGLLVMGVILIWKYIVWMESIPVADRRVMFRNLFTVRSFRAFKEAIMEGLLHRRIFKINPLLGYMHASLATGWFLLIVMGSIESKFGQKDVFNMPWDPIFFNYFEPNKHGIEYGSFFTFMMDFLLLVVLVSVVFALIKRFYSRLFGMKKTTKLMIADQFALYSLWAIFPARLLAESLNAAHYNNGGFMTQTLGDFFNSFMSAGQVVTAEYSMWWVYSIVLAAFFVALPFSRYMHILTEILLIVFRNLGMKPAKNLQGYTRFEINSCSRCGICIDKCQLSSAAGISNVQPAYYIQGVRYNLPFEDRAYNCLMCGRCNTYCPVKIDVTNMRNVTRKLANESVGFKYDYLPEIKKEELSEVTNVVYFAGCMSHLTPSVPRAMVALFNEAGITYNFVDEDGSLCCGRPLMQSGLTDAAAQLREKLTELIKAQNSMILVTSCPICYKTFKEDYTLKMHVVHHTELIKILVESKRLKPRMEDLSIVYHDPCELGRGCGEYDSARTVLNQVGQMISIDQEKEKGLCCGGSISNLKVPYEKRELMAADAVRQLSASNPDVIVTACPLCKKTMAKHADGKMKDIAEVVAEAVGVVKQTKQIEEAEEVQAV
jgi:Fe-S oxidoreductase